MRVQQQLHSSPRTSPRNARSISFAPMWLKSLGTENSHRRNPVRRTCFPVGVSSAVTLTRGFPALAMINGVPLAAWSTSLDKWVFALWMLTVVMAFASQVKLGSLSLVYARRTVKQNCVAHPGITHIRGLVPELSEQSSGCAR